MSKQKAKKRTKAVSKRFQEMDMFGKFTEALKMDEKGTPRNAIIAKLGVSSATFYKWIKNPQYWADQYEAKPDELKRTTNNIIASMKREETSLNTVRSLLSDLNLNEYELEFMYHYIEKRNSTEALLRTLPPDTNISRQTVKLKALRLMKRQAIREGIDRIMQWELEGIHVTLANDIVSQLYHMAFYDPAMFIDGAGNSRFESLDDVPVEYRCCVLGIKKAFHPKDVSKVYYEIQLADRMLAMKELMQYAHMYEDNNKGLATLGEGLKKIGDLLEKNKFNNTIPSGFENVTNSVVKAS